MPRDFNFYLDDILESINRILEYSAGQGFETFAEDRKTVDAVVRNLEIIGEAARNLPDDVKEAMTGIQWKKIIALRNILTHEYFGINKQIVWDVVQTKLNPLKSACEKVMKQ
jgi:uncharacterized protein with HEPN domain